ncbi:hypothetical protein [Parachitinimonas caeni]|uniref:Uncharacterized protein n=1 Tax=Parachitinimonas caeni TaxID=3031301 RepID=A0ABT7E1Q7_9NEIS|nr:hypothetical protein [Parachitinimonas caeni]MDK2126245.1 hypothetical protein [Parachitinimonas caeni]
MNTYLLIGSLVAEEPLATCSRDLKDAYEAENGPNKPTPVPVMQTAMGNRLYFPATGIRGALRRCSRDVIRQHVIAATGNAKPWSLDQHYLMTLGGLQSEESDRASVADVEKWRQANVHISLFGGGGVGYLNFVQGHLNVGNAICEDACEPTIFSGARVDDFSRDGRQIAYLSDGDIQSLIQRSHSVKARTDMAKQLKIAQKAWRDAKASGGDVDAAKAEMAALEDQIAASKKAGSVSVKMARAGYQAIPQGARMAQRCRLLQSNPVELGCLLAALSEFAMQPHLGAHGGTGCGLVSGEWEVFEVLSTGKQSLGMIKLTPYEPLELGSPALLEARSAFDSYLSSGKWDFSVPQSS